MPPRPAHLHAERKDFDTLISHQTNAPCLRDTFGVKTETESVLAFFLRLYAFFFAQFSDELLQMGNFSPPSCVGTKRLKTRLMTTGPYQVSLRAIDEVCHPQALQVRTVPPKVSGRRGTTWAVLFPGALRARFFETGNIVSSLEMATQHVCTQPMRGTIGEISETPFRRGAIPLPMVSQGRVRIIQRLIPP